jgi:cytochrome c nitrite reductase small subunit
VVAVPPLRHGRQGNPLQGLILTPSFQPQVKMSLSKRKILFYVLIAAAMAAVLGIFAAFGPPGLYAKSESPEFCGSCHVLQPEYEAWFHSGAHRNVKCVDCHLPNDTFVNHLFWKSVDGVKDSLAFHTGRVSETIRISDHGAKVVLANCQRCHAETISRINEDRQCWDCHRRLSHKRTGAIETRTP